MANQPDIMARFTLDEDGKPQFHMSPDSDLKHYQITLEAAAPPSTQSVVFTLDPTYFDAVREVETQAPTGAFTEDITSYGDYEVQLSTSALVPSENAKVRQWLSEALKKGHAGELNANPAILSAIREIEQH